MAPIARTILSDDDGRPPCKPVRIGQLLHVFRQQGDVGGLQCDVRPRRAHGDADVGASQCGGIVDAIADESDLAITREVADLEHLVLRQHLGMNLAGRKAKFRTDAQGHRPAVAGHHHDAVDATGAKRGQRRG